MLIELYGENFGCFRDRFVLSLVAADFTREEDSERGVIEVPISGVDEPLRLLRCVAIFGANASGKSTIIRAAGALEYLISKTQKLRSDSPLKWHEPFALGAKRKEEVTLGAKAVIEGDLYDFSVSYTAEAIVRERLVRWRLDKEIVFFERKRQKVSGTWNKYEQFKLITENFRRNALLLSLADSLAPKLAGNIAVGLRRLLSQAPRTKVPARGMPATFHPSKPHSDVASRASRDKPFREWLVARLKSADVGVVGLRVEKRSPGGGWSEVNENESRRERESGDHGALYRLKLLHSGERGAQALRYLRESDGTKLMVDFTPLLYDLTHGEKSQAAFVDELDRSMHPVLLRELVRDLNREAAGEQTPGQLVFTAHETGLMESYDGRPPALRRDQVYFTKKNTMGESELYSLTEYKDAARPVHNIRKRYLGGLYGAIPLVDELSL